MEGLTRNNFVKITNKLAILQLQWKTANKMKQPKQFQFMVFILEISIELPKMVESDAEEPNINMIFLLVIKSIPKLLVKRRQV